MMDDDDELEATNLDFHLPDYVFPNELAEKIVAVFREIREKQGITSEDVSSHMGGNRNELIDSLAKQAISKILIKENLSPNDNAECYNNNNIENLVLQILSYM
ncbi:MAG: hypothetical protein COA79_24100 [Planctomycetota bacterium]|nr:MAG: hypothetical protein COA79_24100 [Planctomycetota bacterium]